MRRTLLTVGIAFGALAGPAQASDVVVQHVNPTCTGGDECRYFTEQPYDNFRLVGSPGERNRITVRATGAGTRTITFRDDGAPIREIANCERVADNEVRCAGVGVAVDAGDMDDTVFAEGDLVSVQGGPGNDELNGGERQESLSGGPGSDVLRGGGEFDTLYDSHPGAADDADVYDAGPGGGRVSYEASNARVDVDLSTPGAETGEEGERDRVVGVTAVTGGTADDRLTAGPVAASLQGGPGDDELTGGPAGDALAGGSGTNVIAAGAGRDTIVDDAPGRSGRMQVACGDALDEVQGPDAGDLLAPDCERVQTIGGAVARSLLPLRSLTSRVVKAGGFECFGRGRPVIELRVAASYRTRGLPRAGTLLGRRVATRRACHASRPASVRLSARGRRLLRAHGRLPVEVRLRDPGGEGPEAYVTQLNAP